MRRPPSAEQFVRDRLTTVSYGALGSYGFWLYAFGPALALLRVQLHFSYTTLGLSSAAWAAGATLVGMTFSRASRRLGRRALLWISALGACTGAALLSLAWSVPVILAGATVLGFAGTMVQTSTQSILSDHHDRQRNRALVEANAVAGACGVIAPLSLGLLQETAATWRLGMALPALVLGVLYLSNRNLAFPTSPIPPLPLSALPGAKGNNATSPPLPRAAVMFAFLTAVGIAVEFCIVYFGAELLIARTHLSTATAATAMVLFYGGIFIARLAAAPLTHRAHRAVPILWLSLTTTTAGFAAFWLSGAAWLALAGLFIAGLGAGNLFPLSLALTMAAAPGQTDAANARTQLLGGLVVIVAPYALGSLADHIGLTTAFATEPFLLVICGGLLVAGARVGRRAITDGKTGVQPRTTKR